ncbi:unnamed protein product [Ixodes hexagonus]
MDVLSLPDEIWAQVLRYLQPEDLLALECAASRFARLTHDRAVLRTVRFRRALGDDQVRRFFVAPRASALSHLDLTNCDWLKGALAEQCLGRCINLRVLKLLNCRVTLLALVGLLETRLTKLEDLEWSLVCSDNALVPALRKLDTGGHALSRSLRRMYVELLESAPHVDLLARLLSRCVALTDVHLHVHGSSQPGSDRGFPDATRCTPLMELETVTYTTDAVRGRCPYASRSALIESPQLWLVLLGGDEELVHAFRVYATLWGNVTLRLRPRRARSCVHMSELLEPASVPSPCEGLSQLCTALESPAQLSQALRGAYWSQLETLTLVSTLPSSPGGLDFGQPLARLLGACGRLSELNLSRFHFAADLDCCALLGASGLRLRALALPACALAGGSLARLAPLGLRELDVRASVPTAHSACVACRDPRMPDPLGPLALLGPLDRLTLCDLASVQSLAFLRNCRVAELRLSGLGRRGLCFYPQGLGQLLQTNDALRSLKLEHPALALSSHLLWDALGQAPRLRRLCLASSAPRETPQPASVLRCLHRLPALEALHIHQDGPPPRTLHKVLRDALGTGGPRIDLGFGDDTFPCERSVLCHSCNFIGLAKPRNRQPMVAGGDALPPGAWPSVPQTSQLRACAAGVQ